MAVDVCIISHHNINECKSNFEKLTKPINMFSPYAFYQN